MPEVTWNEESVDIPEGDNRQVCFSSDIATAQEYDVIVGARPKDPSPAIRGRFQLCYTV